MKSFAEIMADNIRKETGEEPYWIRLPDGSQMPEPKNIHKNRVKKMVKLIDKIRPNTTKMGDMGI